MPEEMGLNSGQRYLMASEAESSIVQFNALGHHGADGTNTINDSIVKGDPLATHRRSIRDRSVASSHRYQLAQNYYPDATQSGITVIEQDQGQIS